MKQYAQKSLLVELSLVARLLLVISLGAALAGVARSDEPYARSRNYDLQHSKISMRFDAEKKMVFGDVVHSLVILRDAIPKIEFDSVGLTIQSVTVNKAAAKFEVLPAKLVVALPNAAKAGDKFDIAIHYEGKPTKGLFFILPDKDYPERAKQIWSQGESEDTRYYLPTYDYPNDRLTTETILTVPATWTTIANGKLISVSDDKKGMKTWTWKEAIPSSTYLITVVAGEFDEVKDSLHGLPLTYYAPKGRGDRLAINYGRTPAMIELFDRKLGVNYAWEKYAQVMVDDFVAGGMENSSATTNASTSLVNPKLAPEYATGQDDLISHELFHQWFGDLVTCKDWGNIWLNEGFATFGETIWSEASAGKDDTDYLRWNNSRDWFAESNLFKKSIVRHDFDDSSEFDQNSYGKGGWVLDMLRHQLGEDQFYLGLKHYLEVNRGKNVVTTDLTKAIEEATHTNVDEFFNQWVYNAGAPELDLAYTYDNEKHRVALTVKQTQKVADRVGIFKFPVDVEITNATGSKLFPITVSQKSETFELPSESVPVMVLFDKGDHILKTANFHKEKAEWLAQARNAAEAPDRADAVVALGKIKSDDEVVAALGERLHSDKVWGVRVTAADSLSRLGTPAAAKLLLDALDADNKPWVRARIVTSLGNFKNDPKIAERMNAIAKQDSSYRARAAALLALGKLKAPNALEILTTAAQGDSPDGFLRNSALRSLGPLGDDKAVPLLTQWSAPGHPTDSRSAAIRSLGNLDKNNQEITKLIASYLYEPHFSVRFSSIAALGARGDSSAIPALEELLKSSDLSIEMVPVIREQIAQLKSPGAKMNPHRPADDEPAAEDQAAPADDQRMDRVEKLLEEMSERLKAIEKRMGPAAKP